MKTHVTFSTVWQFGSLNNHYPDSWHLFILFIYLKSSKKHTSAAPLLLEKGAEVKMKLQDLKLLIDKKH